MLKKKLALFFLMLVPVLGVLATRAQEAVDLTFVSWGGPEEEAVLRALVDQFNAENPDIQIEYALWPDLVTDLRAALEAGSPPDIAFIPDYEFWDFVSRGQLINLQPLVDQSAIINPDSMWLSALSRFRFDFTDFTFGEGDLYALPKDIGPMLLYINEDLFEEAGVPLPDPEMPMTWDEVVAVATLLTRDANGRTPADADFDRYSIEQYGLGDLRWEIAVYGNGGRIISEDGHTFVGAADPNTLQALQWLSDLRNVHYVTPIAVSDALSPAEMFADGRVAMITDGRWQVPGFESSLPFKWSIRPNPVGPSGQLTTQGNQADCSSSGWSSSTGISVIAGSQGEENLEEAYRFIEYLASPEAQAAQAALNFALPNDMATTSEANAVTQNEAISNAIVREAARCQLAPPWTQTPYYGVWFDPLFWDGVWADVVVDNTMSADEAFASRAESFQQALDDAWNQLAAG